VGANRSVLVTGSSGYVGRRLVARLAERGTPVRALVHRSRHDLPDGVEAVEGDITDGASLASACEGVDVVVNLASITADRKPPSGGYDRVNAEGPAALAAAARAAGVRRLVHLAGIDTTVGPPGPYLAGRRRGDAAVLASGIESVAILRPSIMFGGRDSAFVRALARLVKLAPAVPVPGDGTVRLQMVWVEDVVRCVMQLADDMRPGQFPIGGPEQPTYDEVLDIIGEGLGKRHVRKLHLPVPVFSVQARMLALLPKPPLTPAALELFADDNVTTIDAIEQQFGFRPRGFAEHVRREGLYA
jgi:nucleoside-diphosphate-sugar epimerase